MTEKYTGPQPQEWTGAEFELVFYEVRAKWLKDRVGPDPKILWELSYQGRWCEQGTVPAFEPHIKYRWKPTPKRTVNIGGVELVAPEREAPAEGSVYYDLADAPRVQRWGGCYQVALAQGRVFLTREDAEAMRVAQMKQRLGQ